MDFNGELNLYCDNHQQTQCAQRTDITKRILNNTTLLVHKSEYTIFNILKVLMIYGLKVSRLKAGLNKLVYRLIVMFLSTEIFSKRRKIYAWFEEKPE